MGYFKSAILYNIVLFNTLFLIGDNSNNAERSEKFHLFW